MALKQHKIAFTDEQWLVLEDMSHERRISVGALIREIVDATLKLYVRKDTIK